MAWNDERDRILGEVSARPGGLDTHLIALADHARQGADPADIEAVRRELISEHERLILR